MGIGSRMKILLRQVSRMDKKLYDWLFSNIEEIIDMAGEQE